MIAERLDALIRAIPTDPTRMVPAPSVTAERKKRKKRKKRKNKDKNKNGEENIFARCQTQVDPCAAFLRNTCGTDPSCDAGIACCNSLATCDFRTFLFCLNTPG